MDCKDSLRNRIRIFTEAIVLMVCPVLLSFALKKVKLIDKKGSNKILDSISPIGAFTLEAGILPFLCLCLSKTLGERLSSWLLLASKLLIHMCAILLMVLAFVILILIINNIVYLCIWIPFVPVILWLCYNSVQEDEEAHEKDDDGKEAERSCRKLENSVDFSASITVLLFLGLEGLALEGQASASAIEGLDAHLAASLVVSFATCVLGVSIMLVGTLPPAPMMCGMRLLVCFLGAMDALMASALGAIVLLITMVPLRELAWLVFTPLLPSFLVWVFRSIDDDDDDDQTRGGGEEVKPMSLELTKAVFVGFLAVSIPSFSDSKISIHYPHAFVLLTGSAIIAGLGGRLITHKDRPSPAMASAGNVASFCAHVCVAAAVVPFACISVMTLRSLKTEM